MLTKILTRSFPRFSRPLFLVLLIFSLYVTPAIGNPPPNASRLVAQLEVKDGLLIVDRKHSTFEPTADFKSRLKIPLERATQMLYDDLDRQLAALGKPYYSALSPSEQQKDDEGKLNDDLTGKLRTLSFNWADYQSRFADWVAQDTENRFPLPLTMSQLVNAFEGFANETSLLFDAGDVTHWQMASGQAIFTVVDPIQDWDSAEYAVVLPDAATGGTVSNTDEIKKEALKPLVGRLWRGSDIKTRIEVFYARRGLTPIITLSPSNQTPKTITIRESLRIARLVLPVTDDSDADIDKILYLLLNDKQSRFFRKNRKDILSNSTIPDEPGFRAIDYVTHLHSEKNNEPYVNSRTQQIQQLQLADLGYVFSMSPSGARPQPDGITYVDMVIKKQTSNNSAPTGSPEQDVKPTAATDTAQGVVTAESQERESIPQPSRKAALFASGKPAPKDPVKEADSTKELKNYIGGGFEYRPGQGVKAFGLYQRSKFEFLGNDKFSLKVGGQERALGAINYNSDFVQFKNLPFRLGLQLTGSSEVTANRFFNGVTVDERRTGGLASVKFQFFRDKGGSLLQAFGEVRNATVSLTPEKAAEIKQNLNTIDVGALYFYQSSATSRYQRMIRVAPRVRFGLGLAKTEQAFRKFSLTGEIDQELPKLLALNVRGRLEWADSNTPIFELPSLGGTEILRGFRQDDALGQRLWTFQNELKIPVPGTGNAVDGIGLFLQQKVKLAGFFDIGNIEKTTGSSSGLRKSPGVGIRLLYFPVELGLDWAYGFGPAATTGHGRGRFAMTVRVLLPE